jgi:hypothetical protein
VKTARGKTKLKTLWADMCRAVRVRPIFGCPAQNLQLIYRFQQNPLVREKRLWYNSLVL